jgi:tripartite-type tricarboxylate transporter receptor subunit TctC
LTIPSALPYTKSDKLRPLAVTSDKRVSALPDLPTMQEAGIENFVVGQWQGVLAPKDTPPEVVTRLNAEISKVLQQPGVAKQLADQGGEIVGSTSQQFEKHLKAEFEEWRNLIKNIGLRKQ